MNKSGETYCGEKSSNIWESKIRIPEKSGTEETRDSIV